MPVRAAPGLLLPATVAPQAVEVLAPPRPLVAKMLWAPVATPLAARRNREAHRVSVGRNRARAARSIREARRNSAGGNRARAARSIREARRDSVGRRNQARAV